MIELNRTPQAELYWMQSDFPDNPEAGDVPADRKLAAVDRNGIVYHPAELFFTSRETFLEAARAYGTVRVAVPDDIDLMCVESGFLASALPQYADELEQINGKLRQQALPKLNFTNN